VQTVGFLQQLNLADKIGIKSKIRDFVLNENITPLISHLTTYRASVTKADLLSDPLTAPLVEHRVQQQWLGYNRHVIMYPILNGEAYSIGGTHPASKQSTSQANIGVYSQPAEAENLQAQLKDFHPTVLKIFEKATDIKEWTLAEIQRLPRWTNGRVVLVGDAAHATFPYLGQGAAMATEDAAALVECVKRAQSYDKNTCVVMDLTETQN
jgi:salicylate hydroxylase